MTSMWTAASDRDYYDAREPFPEDDEERCHSCGAGELEACEEWCDTNRPAEEPAPAGPAIAPAEFLEAA